jgi:glycosyltransferase involved in cell wall biosynthesis
MHERGAKGGDRRVAIVHYWLVGMRGGERVLERLLRLFPEADIFTHVYDPAAVSELIRSRRVRTTFIDRLPGARRHYQKYLPLMPMALEELDLTGYDLVISNESGPAKGVITAPGSLHVCYCFSPMRYLWDHYPEYRAAAGPIGRMAMPWLFHNLRVWDTTSAARVDRVVAISNFIQQRVRKFWRRDSVVVYPPVETSLFHPAAEVGTRWLWVGQMTPYKRADLAVDAFNALGLPLLMVGDGEMAAATRRRAGSNITIIPRMSFDDLRAAYASCRALVFTAEEDFGITPVEAMASGRPVLAYGRGGALDTVEAERSGAFFDEQTPECLAESVRSMDRWLPHFDPAEAVRSAARFSPDVFDAGIMAATTP